jgi:uncharacterized protein
MSMRAGYQNWRRLLFLHWPLAESDVRQFVPNSFEVDTFDGSAFIGLIPYAVEAARPLGAPPAVGLRFLETNVRTYVRTATGEPGVLFFSLDAASLLAAVGARFLLGLPYFCSMMRTPLSPCALPQNFADRNGSFASAKNPTEREVGEAVQRASRHDLVRALAPRYGHVSKAEKGQILDRDGALQPGSKRQSRAKLVRCSRGMSLQKGDDRNCR